MSADRRHEDGRRVEDAARAHLQRAGLEFIAANVRCRGGELDLVMRDGGQLAFVEVRYRRHQGYGGGAASVDVRKQRRLVLAAEVFLQRHRQYAALPCRFDVVEASGDAATPELHWIRNAFSAA